jgi:hypothetical protein
MKIIKYLFLVNICILFSCNQKNDNDFTYSEFKEALYYNESLGTFSEQGNLEMCVNRWGQPKYVKSMGTMSDIYGSKLHTIVFNWPNIKVGGKNVEVHFKMDNSGKTIEDVYSNRGTISLNNSKNAIVKEFRLTQN